MKYSMSLAALAATSMVYAGPVARRQTAAVITDDVILNYALTLEHLENRFYIDGLNNYTEEDFAAAGYGATFYANLKEVSFDETTHVNFLSDALGDKAVAECEYSFPSTDVASFVALSSVLEGVGVSAYIGASPYITNADYLVAAASILAVEARHSSYLRASLEQSPFPKPFDDPLSFNAVYTLAAQFIKSCPSTNAALPVAAFPALTLGTTGTITAGSTITLLTVGYTLQPKSGSDSVPIYAAFISLTGPIFAPATPVDGGYSVVIPEGEGLAGQTYVVLTTCGTAPLTDKNTVAGPALLELANTALESS